MPRRNRTRHNGLVSPFCYGISAVAWYGAPLSGAMVFRTGIGAYRSSAPRGVIRMISELVGGVLIAGVMSWYLYRAIAATGAWIVSLPDGRCATMPTIAGDRCLRSAVVRMSPVDEHPGKRPAAC